MIALVVAAGVGALGIDDVGVAGLAAVIEDPLVEGGDHGALGDLGVEAARGVGAGILGVLVGQGCEAVLGGIAALPLGQDLIGLGLGLVLAGLELGVIVVGLAVQTVLVHLDQDVTDIHGLDLVPVALVEADHVVGAGALVEEDVGVAGLTGAVKEPVHENAVGVAGLVVAGVAGLVVALGQLGQQAALLILGIEAVGQGLGLLQGGSGLLLGGIDGVAIGIRGGGGFAGDGDHLVVDVVIVVGVGGVLAVQLVGGVGEAVLIVVHIVLGQDGVLHQLLIGGHAHELAVDELQVALGAEARALGAVVAVGAGLQGLHGGVIVRLHGLVPAHAGFLGGLAQGLDGGHLLGGLIEEVVIPGAAVVGHGALLLLKALAGVQAEVGEVIVVVADEALVVVDVVVLGLGGGVVLPVDGDGGDVPLGDAGLPDQGDDAHHHESDGHQQVDGVAALFLLALLGFLGGLGIGVASAFLLLANFLFSRCAHLFSVLSSFQGMASSRRGKWPQRYPYSIPDSLPFRKSKFRFGAGSAGKKFGKSAKERKKAGAEGPAPVLRCPAPAVWPRYNLHQNGQVGRLRLASPLPTSSRRRQPGGLRTAKRVQRPV